MSESDDAGAPAFAAPERPNVMQSAHTPPPHLQHPGYPGRPPKPRNALATAAFALGMVTLTLGLCWIAAEPFLAPSTDSAEGLSVTMATRAGALFVIGITSLTTLILALLSLRRPGKRARAGIAIGIAMFAPLSTVFGFAASFYR